QKKDDIQGLVSVLGVKYTTARVVAEKAIDLAVKKLGVKANKCQTHRLPISGGKIDDFNSYLQMAKAEGSDVLDEETIEHLVYTYGSNFRVIVSAIKEQPELAERIDSGSYVTKAEIIHAIRYEMALTLVDVVQRRTELGSAGMPSIMILQRCAEIMGDELGWDAEKQQNEIDAVIQKYPLSQLERATA
ncbi:MAG TPA: glycerol-3-phosphate dehydrogenase C-terminal domain-containing protein, partial [Anaerolineales bacterium]|nr:glycerol-3-phosphate dehydrogenase C-terminal domain-containing protein [Anaerolineales bacterium]